MKNKSLLILVATAVAVTGSIMALGYYTDEQGVTHRRGLFGHRERAYQRQLNRQQGYNNHGVVGAASDAAHGVGQTASNVIHDIF